MRHLGRIGGWAAAVAVTAAALAGCASRRTSYGAAPYGGLGERRGGPPTASAPVSPSSAAAANIASLSDLRFSPFGKPETGWGIYMPWIAAEIGAAPVPQGVDFAAALARWQARRGLTADGIMTAETFARLRDEVQARRPFLRERTAARARAGSGGDPAPCPDPPDEATLAWTTPEESWGARPNRARPGTLAAWRRMRAAAARDGALESPLSLQMFSGYRSPSYDAGRCATEGGCDGVRRATCSAHRTGLAIDVVLDGVRPVDSTGEDDRLRLSRSSTYRWLVLNARRFGFVNYPYEPWHWEWTGEPVASPRPLEAVDLLPH